VAFQQCYTDCVSCGDSWVDAFQSRANDESFKQALAHSKVKAVPVKPTPPEGTIRVEYPYPWANFADAFGEVFGDIFTTVEKAFKL
jgi:hypothetical protein